MKEVVFYLIAAAISLVVLGYTVHMFVGGLVSPTAERWLIAAACLAGLAVVSFMAWDVVRRRRLPR